MEQDNNSAEYVALGARIATEQILARQFRAKSEDLTNLQRVHSDLALRFEQGTEQNKRLIESKEDLRTQVHEMNEEIARMKTIKVKSPK